MGEIQMARGRDEVRAIIFVTTLVTVGGLAYVGLVSLIVTQLFGFGFWPSMVGGGLLSLGYLCAQAFLPELIRDYWRDRFGSKP
jgi:cation transporter-like permease